MATLVTGASGFVGSHLVEDLLARGTAVRALVRHPAAVTGLRKRGVDVVVGDVRDPGALRDAVPGADVVYHCAAAVGPGYAKREIYETNLGGVRNVLEALRQAARGRLVFVSTLNVLGTCNLDPADEDLPCRPSGDPAADVKIAAEELIRDYQRRHGVDAVIVRPGFIYGPRDRHNLPRLLRTVERGKFAYIGSRDNVVPVVHVRDVVQALGLAAATSAAGGRVYHVTDGSRTTISELVNYLADLAGAPRPQKVLPYLVPYAGCLFFEWLARLRLYRGPAPIARNSLRFLGTSRYVVIRRARDELGYAPRISYPEGVADTVRWMKEQAHGHVDVVVSS
jgi:nucleoside-diphosphate-sugar epimerase